MNTIDTMRLFCDGRTSVHDVYALLESMGHSRVDCVEAFAILSMQPGRSIRVGSYQKGEMQAELYLTVE